MQVAGVLNAQVGFALFDAWLASVEHRRQAGGIGGSGQIASPLIDAAFKAFEGYLQTAEAMHSAEIAGVGVMLGYGLGKGNGVVTVKQMAPFLALNVMG